MILIPWSARRLSETELADALYETDLRKTDLSGVDLSGRDLYGSILESVDMSNANLSEANLNRTRLRWAVLTNSILRDACIVKADLEDTNLTDSDFSGADLTGAKLCGADMTNANLSATTLAGVTGFFLAKLINTNFADADFTNVNLHGVNLINTNIRGAIGLGCKQDEIAFCQQLLKTLKLEEIRFRKPGEISFSGTTKRSLSDFACPDEPDLWERSATASRMYPTLARYFGIQIWYRTSEDDVIILLRAIEQIASGELSVFPD